MLEFVTSDGPCGVGRRLAARRASPCDPSPVRCGAAFEIAASAAELLGPAWGRRSVRRAGDEGESEDDVLHAKFAISARSSFAIKM